MAKTLAANLRSPITLYIRWAGSSRGPTSEWLRSRYDEPHIFLRLTMVRPRRISIAWAVAVVEREPRQKRPLSRAASPTPVIAWAAVAGPKLAARPEWAAA